MSYLVKKSELDIIHGLSWYGRYLAEDFFIAKTFIKKYGKFITLFFCNDEEKKLNIKRSDMKKKVIKIYKSNLIRTFW